MAKAKTKEGKKRQVEAGAANLAAYHEQRGNQRQQAVTHGAYSSTIRQRYSDRRTTEGVKLAEIIAAIETELGGPSELTAFQQVKIGILRSRLIRFFQFSDYIDKRMDIFDGKGNPISCLTQLHATEEGIARILKELEDSLKSSKVKKVPSLAEILEINRDSEKSTA